MPRWSLVSAQTYRRQVLTRGFIASLLSVPLMIVLSVVLIYVVTELREDRRPVGYVDSAGVLVIPWPAQADKGDDLIRMIPYATTDAAHQALLADDIQVYYVLAADYLQTRNVELVTKKTWSEASAVEFHDFVRQNLLAGQPVEIRERIVQGPAITIRRPEGGREFPRSAGLSDVAPLFIILFMALAFMMLIGLNPGQPMLAVAEEKENRTMEVMLTSMSPGALIAGKIVGSVAVAGTMVAGWMVLIGAAAFVALRVVHVPALEGLRVAPSAILFPASLYVPVYIILAALLTALGATVVEAREAQQMSFMFMLPLMAPLYVLEPIMRSPGGPLALILSLFPLSAPSVMPIRMFIYPVPAWQIGLMAILMALSVVGAIWLAGRAFRLGMLRYGQRLNWRELFAGAGGGQR